MKEVWKKIPGYPLYAVSNLGRVRRWGGKVMKPVMNNSGYFRVSLRPELNAAPKAEFVHKLVARAFLGVRPKNADINHKDGIKTHNYPHNLEYISRAENILHAREKGLFNNYGEGHYKAKLTYEAVRDIRRRGNMPGFDLKAVAKEYGVSPRTVLDVLEGKTWKEN